MKPQGRAARAWRIAAMTVDDLPVVQGWLAPTADPGLPTLAAEAWLLAHGPAPGPVEAWGEPRPLACLRLRARIGEPWPRHWFHVGCVVHAAPALGLYHRQTTLLLGSDHTGASELADFACAPGLDGAGQASALQALMGAAVRHMQAHADAHPGPVIVELPGVRDAQGQRPFWQGLGRHFHDADLDELARRHGPHWRSHLAALLPRQPVYAAFLSAPAQAAMGQAHPAVRGWMDTLSHAGFRYSHHVTITDGGPVFEAHRDSLVAGG